MTTKTYKASYYNTMIFGSGAVFILLVNAVAEGTVFLNWEGCAMTIVVVVVMAMFDMSTWLTLDDIKLRSSGTTIGPRTIALNDIVEVRRVSLSPLIPHTGSTMAFYGEEGFLLHAREGNYPADTIKCFINDFKDRAPKTQLDPQYEELIEGDDEQLRSFKSLPATHCRYK